MKIVINRCFGGFGLSVAAEIEYMRLQGQELFFYKQRELSLRDAEYIKITPVQAEREFIYYAFTRDFGDSMKLDEQDWKQTRFYSRDVERNDSHLIEVVERLGEQSNGPCAKLEIVVIPDDVAWHIEEYDGLEHIAEDHRTWGN